MRNVVTVSLSNWSTFGDALENVNNASKCNSNSINSNSSQWSRPNRSRFRFCLRFRLATTYASRSLSSPAPMAQFLISSRNNNSSSNSDRSFLRARLHPGQN